MKLLIKIIALMQLLLLAAIAYLIYANQTLQKKVYNTNKFVYELLADKKQSAINQINDEDILIGDKNAPVKMVIYSRFDCSACNEFHKENLPKIIQDYVETGKVVIAYRFLTHTSKPATLEMTKGAFFAFKNDTIIPYLEYVSEQYPTIGTEVTSSFFENNTNYTTFVEDVNSTNNILHKADSYRATGIRSTPTIFINQEQIIGNVNYKKIKRTIEQELN